jgi:hypothetical protein
MTWRPTCPCRRYSESRDYDGTLECSPLDTDKYCLAGSTFYCVDGAPCFGRTGKEILTSLEYQGFDKSESQVAWRAGVLLFYVLIWKLFAIMRLYKSAVVTSPNAKAPSSASVAPAARLRVISSINSSMTA